MLMRKRNDCVCLNCVSRTPTAHFSHHPNRIWGMVVMMVVFWILSGVWPGQAGETSWSFRLQPGRFPDPVWEGSDLKILVRQISKSMENALKEVEKTGRILQPPPVAAFPAWSRCQEIGNQARPDLMVVRMNLAALKAAVAMVKGTFDRMDEDRLVEGLPFGYSPGDWGAEILHDFRLQGCSRKALLRVLTIQQGAARELWMDLRDEINRDIVWAHHA